MEKAFPKQRWFRIIPLVFVTFSLAFLDRANFGFAAAGGMAQDLNITPAASSLLGSLFFLGYFCFQIPGAIYAANKSAKKLIFWSLIFWGALSTATGLVSSLNYLMVIRFLLGVVESAVMPALLILLSRWFTKSERSRASTFLALGNPVTILWMSVLSGYLIHSFGWRWMFIIEGIPAIAWAFVWFFLIDDQPSKAKWLDKAEKNALAEALAEEQKQISPVKNYWQAFRSKKVIVLCLQYALWNTGVFGFVMWLPSILNAAPDMNIVKTGWLGSVPYLFAIIGMISGSHYADKLMNRKIFIWPFLLIGSLAFYGSYAVGNDNFWLSFVLLVIAGGAIYTPYGPFFALITETLPRNVAGGAIALINSCGALGSFAGSYIVGYLGGSSGGFSTSYLFLAASLLGAALLMLVKLDGTKKTGFIFSKQMGAVSIDR